MNWHDFRVRNRKIRQAEREAAELEAAELALAPYFLAAYIREASKAIPRSTDVQTVDRRGNWCVSVPLKVRLLEQRCRWH